MNIETLNYPLFKVTKAEADLLCGAMEILKNKHTEFLCTNLYFALIEYKCQTNVYITLTTKIRNSIDFKGSLLRYLKNYCLLNLSFDEKCKIRQIWINKLLEHNDYEKVKLK